MPRFGLVGPSYEAQSLNLDAQKTENWYVEVDESGGGNAPIALMPTPGIQSFVDMTPVIPPPPENAPVFSNFVPVIYVGSVVGNSITTIPFATGELLPGDLVFFTITKQRAAGALQKVLSISDDVTGATYTMLPGSGVTYDAAFEIAPNAGKDLYVFYGTVVNHVPLGNYHVTVNFDSNPNTADCNGLFFSGRFVGALHASAVSTQTVLAAALSYSGSPVTTTVICGLISVIELSSTTTAVAPLVRRIASGGGDRGSAANYANAGDTQAPAGSYTPTWNNSGLGADHEVRMFTAAFVNV